MGNHLCAITPFEFQSDQTLASLGHTKLFDQSIPHDYSKMTKTQGLFTSDAIHKATIELDEEGTIAAAVTGFRMCMSQLQPPPTLEITVNRPFLFFIRSFNHVIFAGRMVDPTK